MESNGSDTTYKQRHCCYTPNPVKTSKLVCETQKSKYNLFDDVIEKKLGIYMYYLQNTTPESYIPNEDKSEEAPPYFPDDADSVESDGTAAFLKTITNNLIHTEVKLPLGEKMKGDKVIVRTKEPNSDTDGKIQ